MTESARTPLCVCGHTEEEHCAATTEIWIGGVEHEGDCDLCACEAYCPEDTKP